MKKFLKYFLIFTLATTVIGLVMTIFQSDEDAMKYDVKELVESGNDARTVKELTKVMAEFDSVKAEFPEFVAYVDSVSAANFDKWAVKVAESEKKELIYNAYYIATEHIKKKMTNPSSAKFATFASNDSKCWEENGIIIAQFWGEGTNAFNAVIRNDYQVKLTYGADGYKIIDAISY